MAEKKKHWMQKAFADSHGQFKAKAKKAGMSTAAYAKEEIQVPQCQYQNQTTGQSGQIGREIWWLLVHQTADAIGKAFFELYQLPHYQNCLDVGALDVNGTLRPHCPVSYTGLDQVAGPNVDFRTGWPPLEYS